MTQVGNRVKPRPAPRPEDAARNSDDGIERKQRVDGELDITFTEPRQDRRGRWRWVLAVLPALALGSLTGRVEQFVAVEWVGLVTAIGFGAIVAMLLAWLFPNETTLRIRRRRIVVSAGVLARQRLELHHVMSVEQPRIAPFGGDSSTNHPMLPVSGSRLDRMYGRGGGPAVRITYVADDGQLGRATFLTSRPTTVLDACEEAGLRVDRTPRRLRRHRGGHGDV